MLLGLRFSFVCVVVLCDSFFFSMSLLAVKVSIAAQMAVGNRLNNSSFQGEQKLFPVGSCLMLTDTCIF